MEGVPALPWAGDAGGRIILPKAVTYEQLAAGAVEFQLYNRQTNALIPTDILRVGDHIEIREKETGGDESPYTIDKFDGARSEIVLTGDGQATRIWGLMGASFNDSVHSVRSFSIRRFVAGSDDKIVTVEIDGKMYLPAVKEGSDHLPINDVDGSFETLDGGNYIIGASVFPIIEVVLEDDPNYGEGARMKIPSIDNLTAEARDTIEVFFRQSYDNNEPWKYGQDGFFWLGGGWALRVNGEWRAISYNGKSVLYDGAMEVNINVAGSDIYRSPEAQLNMAIAEGDDINLFKEEASEDYGITFANDIIVNETTNGDNVQPFFLPEP